VADQPAQLSEIANSLPDSQLLDVLADNTTEAVGYATSIYNAFKPAGNKLKPGPTIALVPIHSGENTPNGTMVCVLNFSQPNFATAKAIAEVLAKNSPIRIWVEQCAGLTSDEIRVIVAAL
jgi:hypothetical protein